MMLSLSLQKGSCHNLRLNAILENWVDWLTLTNINAKIGPNLFSYRCLNSKEIISILKIMVILKTIQLQQHERH